MTSAVNNIVIAGLGGQGVLKASDILADAVFRAGFDVKKSEIHGMSQRGGSVTSDVRFGEQVFSPMVPIGEADFLLVLASDQIETVKRLLRKDGVLISPDRIDENALSNRRSFNVAMLGLLSTHLQIDSSDWLDAIRANLSEKVHDVNIEAFETGRAAAEAL
ncbi:MAG: indolepyruvate oxidoreductase subunit beta [Planctomycetes bacterium]|nr:indolepyruvate oxidoreductase subunit beta [Planctomycetota bacterium]